MSLADACLVRMAELQPGAKVLTLDADFSVYRSQGRRVIPTIVPPRS
jgi:predicted nucleic acid-binding protein